MRLLERHSKVEQAYGGGFVNSINGLKSEPGRGEAGPKDWFYYVNGVEAGRGAAATKVAAGDKIWWDYHDWGEVMRIPALVGSFPRPLTGGAAGKGTVVSLECARPKSRACAQVEHRLKLVSARYVKRALGQIMVKKTVRLLVGQWKELKADPAAALLGEGPGRSGVFARFWDEGAAPRLELLASDGSVVDSAVHGAGIVAATRVVGQGPPVWLVTGTDSAGLLRASALITRKDLHGSFAVAVGDGAKRVKLPVQKGGNGL